MGDYMSKKQIGFITENNDVYCINCGRPLYWVAIRHGKTELMPVYEHDSIGVVLTATSGTCIVCNKTIA